MEFIICLGILFFGAIIVGITTKRTLENTPTINLVGKKLVDNTADDIDEAVKYLKVVNKE